MIELGPYVGDRGPATDLEKITRYAQDQCTGDGECRGEYHIHGCYMPHASNKCDAPGEFGHTDTLAS